MRLGRGRPVLVVELRRPTPAMLPAELAKLAQEYVADGADALAVRTDVEDTPSGLADLFAVARGVTVPVLARDWFLHPLQVYLAFVLDLGLDPYTT